MNNSQSQTKLRKAGIVRRVIFVLVAVAVIVPYILKPNLPGEPNHWAEEVYKRVDTLKPGSHMLLAFNFEPSSGAELYPMVRVVLMHCFKKGVIPVLMTHYTNALNLMKQVVAESADQAKKQWGKDVQPGKDYVILGYRPGDEMLIVNMGENLKGAFDKDLDNRLTQNMPALKGLNSLRDLDLAMDFASSGTTQMWIAYGSDKFGFPLVAGTTAVQAPDLYIYLPPSGQLKGFLGGLRGAADYETLLCRSDNAAVQGPANKGMPSQSAVHVMLVLLILGANVRMIYGKFAGKRKV
jgi:hypothetical protein